MHGLIDFDSVFDGSFGCLYEWDFGEILFFLLGSFLKIIELPDGDTGFFDTFFPDFELLIFEFLLFFSLFLFLFHSEDLNKVRIT